MNALELKLPPPVLAAVLAAGMWVLSSVAPLGPVPGAARVPAAIAFAVIGGAFSVAGALAFRRAQTTVNPLKPHAASSLVCFGVYRITRNPMYVGLSLVLVGWAVFLASAWLLAGPAAFVAYIGRFQIEPEERALAALFGADYADYKARVRRWL